MKDKTQTTEDSREDSAVVSTTAAAKQLGVSVRTIQLWVESGRLSAWKTAGNHRRVFQWSIDQFKADEGHDPEPGARGLRNTTAAPAILVIEDDRTTQVYYQTMLQLLGHEDDVQFADDGIEGLVAVGKYAPWLIILDIDMPRLDGIEVVKTLEEQDVVAEVDVIVISNVSSAEAVSRGLPADCPFYSKPVSLEEFREAIAKARTKAKLGTS